jgi:hypothetical protein
MIKEQEWNTRQQVGFLLLMATTVLTSPFWVVGLIAYFSWAIEVSKRFFGL